jgi:hypothetical protein
MSVSPDEETRYLFTQSPLKRQSMILARRNILCTKVDTTFTHSSSEPIDHIAIILVMKPTPTISEKRAAVFIWIGIALFTGAMFFGH